MRSTTIRRVGALALAASALLAACGDDTESTPASGETTTTVAPTSSSTTTQPSDEPVDEPADDPASDVIEVAVVAGEVTGGGRHQVDLGETVTVRVMSDVTDHIHLHGYDVMVDVVAGETADVVFDATIPGVFEIELEESGVPLLELEIS